MLYSEDWAVPPHQLIHPEKQSASPPSEKMNERRYTEQEEAPEIKSLRRTIAAYAKYAHHRPKPRSARQLRSPLFYPTGPYESAPFIPHGTAIAGVDWKCISSGARRPELEARASACRSESWSRGAMG